MTRDEAIKILKARKNCESDSCPSGVVCYKCDEAFDMAIEALELVTSYEGTINKLTETIADNKSDDGLLIIKSVGFLTKEDLEYVCNEIAEQRKLGVIVLRHGWDAVLVPSDVEIKIEEKEGES